MSVPFEITANLDLRTRMGHPDIVCVVLSHSNRATLATCIRVSNSSFDMAGALLYRELLIGNDGFHQHPLLLYGDYRFKIRLLQFTRSIRFFDIRCPQPSNVCARGLTRLDVCVREPVGVPPWFMDRPDLSPLHTLSSLITSIGPFKHYIERGVTHFGDSARSSELGAPKHVCQHVSSVYGPWNTQHPLDCVRRGIEPALAQTSFATCELVLLAEAAYLTEAMHVWLYEGHQGVSSRNYKHLLQNAGYDMRHLCHAVSRYIGAMSGPAANDGHDSARITIVGIDQEQWATLIVDGDCCGKIFGVDTPSPDMIALYENHVKFTSMRDWAVSDAWRNVCARDELDQWVKQADSGECHAISPPTDRQARVKPRR